MGGVCRFLKLMLRRPQYIYMNEGQRDCTWLSPSGLLCEEGRGGETHESEIQRDKMNQNDRIHHFSAPRHVG